MKSKIRKDKSEIVFRILDAIKKGTKVQTHLMYEVKLSHTQVMRYKKEMVDNGLVSVKEKKWQITELGKKYHSLISKAKMLLQQKQDPIFEEEKEIEREKDKEKKERERERERQRQGQKKSLQGQGSQDNQNNQASQQEQEEEEEEEEEEEQGQKEQEDGQEDLSERPDVNRIEKEKRRIVIEA